MPSRERLADGEAADAASDEDVHTLIDRLLHEEIGDVASQAAHGSQPQRPGRDRDASLDDGRLQAARRGDPSAPAGDASTARRELEARAHARRTRTCSARSRCRRRTGCCRTSGRSSAIGSGCDRGASRRRVAAAGLRRRRRLRLPDLARAAAGHVSASTRSSPNSHRRRQRSRLRRRVALRRRRCSARTSRASPRTSSSTGRASSGSCSSGTRSRSGSSMMPQKRNPDALELARGSAARMLGDLDERCSATLKGLPSSYNKDLQDDKRVAVRRRRHAAARVAGGRRRARRVDVRAASACGPRSSSTMMATDLADYLVRRGATFREAHAAVGGLIRKCESERCELHALPLSAFESAHRLFGADVLQALSSASSVQQREVEGGTGPNAVHAQLDAARAAIRL